MDVVAIMGNGPTDHIPDLQEYLDEVDFWIGVDQGALWLITSGINVDYAVGDFDSVDEKEMQTIKEQVKQFERHLAEKDATDLELAIQKVKEMSPQKVYLFGLTGGRLDHEFINTQMLLQLLENENSIEGKIIDRWNQIELKKPGTYGISKDKCYPYVSLIPFTKHVDNLTLEGFYYPLKNHRLSWGSSLCLSNEIEEEEGIVSFHDGLLLVIKSRDIEGS